MQFYVCAVVRLVVATVMIIIIIINLLKATCSPLSISMSKSNRWFAPHHRYYHENGNRAIKNFQLKLLGNRNIRSQILMISQSLINAIPPHCSASDVKILCSKVTKMKMKLVSWTSWSSWYPRFFCCCLTDNGT